MPAQRVHILDPDGGLTKILGPHADNNRIIIEDFESLLELLEPATVPTASIIDGRGLPERAPTRLAETRRGRLCLVLVVVERSEQGLAWLEAGAADFAVFDAREIAARYARLLALHEVLLTQGRRGPSSTRLRSVLHDMRNHLSGMFGYLELLAHDDDPGQLRQDLGRISESTARILELCKRLEQACREPDSERIVEETP